MGEELFNGGRGEDGFSKAFSEILSNPEMIMPVRVADSMRIISHGMRAINMERTDVFR